MQAAVMLSGSSVVFSATTGTGALWAGFLPGFLLGLSLILVIGPQNAFVLRQGLRGEHVLAVCLTCAVSDAVLIVVGVSGFGLLSGRLPWIGPLLRYGGVAFLLAYGARNFWSAWAGTGGLVVSAQTVVPLGSVLATCLALTWLNPHVYLDTVVLLGSVASQYDGHRLAFGIGAVMASFVFFFALGYGARLLGPIFARPLAWRVLDAAVGSVMWAIAFGLLIG